MLLSSSTVTIFVESTSGDSKPTSGSKFLYSEMSGKLMLFKTYFIKSIYLFVMNFFELTIIRIAYEVD